MLLSGGQTRIEREDLGAGQIQGAEGVVGIADLTLPGKEHEDVRGVGAGWDLCPQLLDGFDNTTDLIALGDNALAVGGQVDQGSIADLDRKGATADLEDRHRAHDVSVLVGGEVSSEALGVDRRGGDDDLEVGAAGQQLLEVAQDEVDVERTLVRLVDDDRVVALEVAITLHLVEEDAVGHHLDARAVTAVIGEADLIADDPGLVGGAGEALPQFLGDALGHRSRRDASRLRVADLASAAATELETHLGQLRGLARAGLARDDHDLVVTDRGQDVVAAGDDRQLLGIVQPLRGDRCRSGRGHLSKDRCLAERRSPSARSPRPPLSPCLLSPRLLSPRRR
jgi:hypothetical protein